MFSSLFFICLKKFSLILCLKVLQFLLFFTPVSKLFQIVAPKYERQFLRLIMFSKGYADPKFIRTPCPLSILGFIKNLIHIFGCKIVRKFVYTYCYKLFDSFPYWEPVYLFQVFISDTLSII